MSIINFVDKILIWDTGSTDNTIQIIKEMQKRTGSKIEFREVGKVDKETFTQKRQEMLEATSADWVFIVDGDEVWSETGLNELREIIAKENPDAIVSPFWSIVDDVYHYQEEKAGKYTIGGKTGFHTIRAFKRDIPGLNASRPFHGGEGFYSEPKRGTNSAYDESGTPIQNLKNLVFQKEKFFHFGNIARSRDDFSTMGRSIIWEVGIPFPLDFYYPEIFFKPRPKIVPSPWEKLSGFDLWKAHLGGSARWIKRRIV